MALCIHDVGRLLEEGKTVYILTRGAYDPRVKDQTAEILKVTDCEEIARQHIAKASNYHAYSFTLNPEARGWELH